MYQTYIATMKSDNVYYNNKYEQVMRDVYMHIFDDFYNHREEAMDHARQSILNNISQLGTEVNDKIIFNVGTGRESMVFLEYGARKVYHRDISEKSVNILNKLSEHDQYKNRIDSKRLDVCSEDGLYVDEEVDIIYLAGVFHHLYDYNQALKNLFDITGNGSRIFFHIYRSGSLHYFVIDFIRKFISYDDVTIISKIAKNKFKEIKECRGIYTLYDVMYDDFFVPTLNLFSPAAINNILSANSFINNTDKVYSEFNHSSILHYNNFYWTKSDNPYSGASGVPDLCHIDQIKDINYLDITIDKTVSLMNEFLNNIIRIDKSVQFECAIDLFTIVKLIRSNKVSNMARS